MTLQRINDFDREKLHAYYYLADAFILKMIFYNKNVAGDDISMSLVKGDSSYIQEFPDQEIYDNCGFTLVVTSVEGEQFTPDQTFRHLTGIDDARYATQNIQDMMADTLRLTFPASMN